MDESPRCKECDVPLTGQAISGLCANCLLKLALEPPVEATAVADEPGEAITVETSAPREAVGSRIGRYKLLQKIGEGGFGIVYLAEQTEPARRRVALKVLKPGMDTREVVARFEAERQALALMDHPNIARVFDGGATESGRPYFVMELVKGIPLTKYCDDHQLNTRQRLDLFLDVLAAVQHAHQKGIIHRDLKPSNTLVSPHDGRPVIKVIDFGIAKAISMDLTDKTLFTAHGRMIGTPQYMSPEQAEINALDVDTRSDLCSLGIILYELLTGRTPLDAKKLRKAAYAEIQRLIREEEPPKPSTRLKQEQTAMHQPGSVNSALRIPQSAIDQDPDWIVMKALAKDRSHRYETANGLAMDIQRHLADEPVVARPPSLGYRAGKFVRKHKGPVAAAAAVLLGLLGLAASTVLYLAQRSKAQAIEQAARTEQRLRRIADTEREAATASEIHARRLLYAADMNLAGQTLQLSNPGLETLRLSNLGLARRLLDRHRPEPGNQDLRGWEWRYLWEQCRGDPFTFLTKGESYAFSVSFSADGRRLAAGFNEGRVELWDVPGRKLLRVLQEKTGRVARVAFSPVGDALAATGEPNVVKLHDFAAGSERVLCTAPGFIRDLSRSQAMAINWRW